MLVKERVVRECGPDHTMALLNEGYLFIKNRTKQGHCRLFVTHLLGEKVICMTGVNAAKIFYDTERFTRKGVAPKRIQKTLFGENAIQGMNGTAHHYRKQLFLSLMASQQQQQLAAITRAKLEAAIDVWRKKDQIVLFDEIKQILCASACKWAGVPLRQSEILGRAEDFSAMVDGFGAVGPRHYRGRSARTRAEKWIGGMIVAVRSGKLKTIEGTALHEIAFHNEPDGSFMNPFVAARVRKDFIWNEYYFDKGTLVLLDVFGTNHDSQIWDQPYEFMPERFQTWNGDLYQFIPQGGGDAAVTHRCPGEGITIEIMKTVINFLVNRIDYIVPKQVLSYPMNRIPTLPESGFIMTNIRLK